MAGEAGEALGGVFQPPLPKVFLESGRPRCYSNTMRSVLVFVIGGVAVAMMFAEMTWLVVIAVTLCSLAVALYEHQNDQLRETVDHLRDELARYKGERRAAIRPRVAI
jgi:cell division protein FtsB